MLPEKVDVQRLKRVMDEDGNVVIEILNEPSGESARAEKRYIEKPTYDEEGIQIDTEIITLLGHYLSATIDSAGNYELSGVPEDEQVAIIYYGEKKIEAQAMEIPEL